MTLYASKSYNNGLGGFLDDGLTYPVWPSDAVEITEAEHRALLDGQAAGQVIQFNTVSPPALVAPPVNLLVYANQKQWALATGGYTATIAGKSLTFETNGDSRSLIDGKVSRLGQANPPATIKWQFPTGFVDLAAADFLSAAIRIADFVQSTFDALDTVEQQIAAGTLKTTADVDAFAWPTNHD